MQQLEIIYEKKLKNKIFIDRKFKMSTHNEVIYSPPRSGKTHLIIDFLQNIPKESYLYIDLSDERVDLEISTQKLAKFIEKNGIDLLVIEHFDFSFELPKNLKQIIITTDNMQTNIKNFKKSYLYPLDFEEFIAFDKRHFEISRLFDVFAKQGSLPEVVLYNEENYIRKLQNIAKEILNNKIEFILFKRFCELQGNKISLFQIYNQLRTKIKISKDSLYKVAASLQNRGLIILLEKFNQPKASKKVYLFDFSIKNSLTFKKDFPKKFDNMVFLELYKKRYKIYYAENIDFFLPEFKRAIITSPFSPIDIVEKKMQKIINNFKSLDIKFVQIVTLNNEGKFSIDDIKFRLIPYWEWALQIDF